MYPSGSVEPFAGIGPLQHVSHCCTIVACTIGPSLLAVDEMLTGAHRNQVSFSCCSFRLFVTVMRLSTLVVVASSEPAWCVCVEPIALTTESVGHLVMVDTRTCPWPVALDNRHELHGR